MQKSFSKMQTTRNFVKTIEMSETKFLSMIKNFVLDRDKISLVNKVHTLLTIKDLLNKIKWDKKEVPEDYVVVYEDRVEGEEREIPFLNIKKVEEGFMIIDKGGEETNIPIHRIRKILKKGKLIWQRKN